MFIFPFTFVLAAFDHFLPSEFTTMSGRRLRDAVKTVLSTASNEEFNGKLHVVIAGLTNTYSQYVTTYEEYQAQRYEVSFLVPDCYDISLTS